MEHRRELVHLSFPHAGPWGDEMTKTFATHGDNWLCGAPGLLWKVWTQNRYAGRVGATCLFNSNCAANEYLSDQLPKLEQLGLNTPKIERYSCI